VCYPDVPVPYSHVLEYEALPTRDKIAAAIEAVMKG
jgi:pyruvate/2-oxoglutarate/acetoin dehydrogenase E1 component